MDLPDSCAAIVEYARTAALEYLAKDPNVRGVGLGLKMVRGKKTGEYAVQFLVHEKIPLRRVPRGCRLPQSVAWEGQKLLVDVLACDGDIFLTQRTCAAATGRASTCAGAVIGNEPPTAMGVHGTFGGTWRPITGGNPRGLVCGHSALGFGFRNFVASLPGSIAWLFRSPAGEEIYTNSFAAFNNFRIMRIDTPWPILAPMGPSVPVPGGGLALLYLDCAAGRVNYRGLPGIFGPTVPPPRAPVSGIAGGSRIRSARPPLPGTPVYKIGDTTTFTWGEIALSFFQFPIAVGPLVIVFDQILCRLSIAGGDSGAPLLTQSGNNYLGSCWGGLPLGGPPRPIPRTNNFIFTHTLATPAHQIWWRMNLDLF